MSPRRVLLSALLTTTLALAGWLAPAGVAPMLPPVPAADAAGLTVTKVSLTSPIKRGRQATIAVRTTAAARCTIKVFYKTGPSTAKGLGPKTANGRGQVRWTWTVGTNTTPGRWPVTVSCKRGAKTGSLTVRIRVTGS